MLLPFIFLFYLKSGCIYFWLNGSLSTQISLHPVVSPRHPATSAGWRGGNQLPQLYLIRGI